MLATILSTQHTYFEALAKSWLVSGATAFAVWANNKPVLNWPAHETAVDPSLRESMYVGGFSIGELRVVGRDDPAAQTRLQAEAELIAQLIQSTQNLSSFLSFGLRFLADSMSPPICCFRTYTILIINPY